MPPNVSPPPGIPSENFVKRRDKLRQALRRARVPSLLVSCPFNVSYLTGFTGDSSWLWIDATTQRLFSDGRFEEQLADECPDLECTIRASSVPLIDAVGAWLKKLKAPSVGFEADHFTVAQWQRLGEVAGGGATLVPTRGLVATLREIKDKAEVRLIQAAIESAEQAFQAVLKGLSAETTEKQLADDLDYAMRRSGAVGSSFPSIVGVGPRAALPHGHPTDRKLGDSPFVLIDWGARRHQYISDLTRVVATGTLSSKFRRIYDLVLAAQHAAIEAIRPGQLMSAVDAAARETIHRGGFGPRFNHGLGHGIGLEVHETVRLARGQDRELKAGMVVTVEPGIYLPGWGGVRIEDDILVTADGCRRLSTLPRDLDAMRITL